MVMLVACETCRQRKRKCDRGVPTCALCIKRGRNCFYPPHRLIKSQNTAQPDNASPSPSSQAWDITMNSVFQAWALQSPDVPISYPVPFRWYIPRLLKHFSEGLGVSHVPVAANSTAYHIQTLWLQGAMSDPGLFHATLYAGASHFDLSRGERQSSITLYHQAEAIRLINERLSDPKAAVDDRTLVAVTPLALFADLNGDRAAADIHREGLRKLVQMRGGLDRLGFEGLTSVLIQMNNIIYNIAFDLPPESLIPLGPPPLSLEKRILRTPSHLLTKIHSLRSILSIFKDIHTFKLAFWTQEFTPNTPTTLPDTHLANYTSSMPELGLECPVYYCCYLAVTLFRTIASASTSDRTGSSSSTPSSSSEIDALASELKAALALTDPDLWIRRIPAVFSWVCLVGAAAASDSHSRVWFYFKQASAVRVLNVRGSSSSSGGGGGEAPYLEELWEHFRWLRTLRLNPVRYIVEETV
ncbi:hypothetical protein BJY01DRAFT_241301 [Aspergillus pseudoustus]|uniref:Zn(2)-C6 fungal-type domain-containing protein n=1 Tax=Aspergillus pseudoustus TaxID=1810923 RepID=A0ABR4IG35_9EURO